MQKPNSTPFLTFFTLAVLAVVCLFPYVRDFMPASFDPNYSGSLPGVDYQSIPYWINGYYYEFTMLSRTANVLFWVFLLYKVNGMADASLSKMYPHLNIDTQHVGLSALPKNLIIGILSVLTVSLLSDVSRAQELAELVVSGAVVPVY